MRGRTIAISIANLIFAAGALAQFTSPRAVVVDLYKSTTQNKALLAKQEPCARGQNFHKATRRLIWKDAHGRR
jgi:hypothetical protein